MIASLYEHGTIGGLTGGRRVGRRVNARHTHTRARRSARINC